MKKSLILTLAILFLSILSGCTVEYTEQELLDNANKSAPYNHALKNDDLGFSIGLDMKIDNIVNIELQPKEQRIKIEFVSSFNAELGSLKSESFDCEKVIISFSSKVENDKLMIVEPKINEFFCEKDYSNYTRQINEIVFIKIDLYELLGINTSLVKNVYIKENSFYVEWSLL